MNWDIFTSWNNIQPTVKANELQQNTKYMNRDFPGGPAVKNSPFNAGGMGPILGQGTKIPHASSPKYQNIKQKQYCNKFNEDLNFHIKKKKT